MYSIYFLWLLVFVGWPYVVGVLCVSVVQSPWSLVLGALGMSLVWVMWALLLYLDLDCCDLFVGGIISPGSWLQGSTPTTPCTLLYRYWQNKTRQLKKTEPKQAKKKQKPCNSSKIDYKRAKTNTNGKRNNIVKENKKNMRNSKERKVIMKGGRKRNNKSMKLKEKIAKKEQRKEKFKNRRKGKNKEQME